MAKVLGIGGVFFKSPDPKKLYAWYAKWLRMEFEDWGLAYFPKDMPPNSQTVWSAFDATAKYFDPSEKGFMFNLIVDNLEEALKQVKKVAQRLLARWRKWNTARLDGLWIRREIKLNCGSR